MISMEIVVSATEVRDGSTLIDASKTTGILRVILSPLEDRSSFGFKILGSLICNLNFGFDVPKSSVFKPSRILSLANDLAVVSWSDPLVRLRF